MGRAVYQKLQNLTMNKTGEVIDLECPLDGNIGIEAQISINRPNGNYGDYYAFGARDVSSGHAIMGAAQLYRYGTYQTTFFYGTSSTYWSYASPVNLMTYRIIVPASGSVTLQGSSSRTVQRQSFSYPSHNLYIFGVHVKDGDKEYVEHNNTGYVIYVKVTNRGTLIRDMVPVKRLSDGICGLFDRVSKKFFITKSGNTSCLSGTVVANTYYDNQGNQINSLESLNEKLENIEETKSQIKLALQNKGVEVSDSDSFRSYAEKINAIEISEGTDTEVPDTYDTISVGGSSCVITFGYGYAGLAANGIDFTDDLVNGYDENRTAVALKNGSIIELRTSYDEFVNALITASQDENLSEEERFTNYIGLTPDKIKKGYTILGVEGTAE